MSLIPFNRPGVVGNELAYMQEALANNHISGDGSFTRKCHDFLEHSLGVTKALLTTSGTAALEMAALLLKIRPGDEVIVPSFTFVSTINAFVLRGAKPVFADIRPDTLNLDETRLAPLLTPRTRAIVLVHYAGIGCEMPAILTIAADHGLPVVEDNAHGLFGKINGRFLGTFGVMATQSFHETKNFTCGEGGALLINDPQLIDRAEIIREKGTNRTRFFRGQVDKYSWVDIGSSYLPSDLNAAFLYAQFEAHRQIQTARQKVWARYHNALMPWAASGGIRLPYIPTHCEQPYHMFYLIVPTLDERQRLIGHLKQREIVSVFHYLPLHLSTMGRQFGARDGDCPVTEEISDRLLRLPFFNDLSDTDQDRVIEGLLAFD